MPPVELLRIFSTNLILWMQHYHHCQYFHYMEKHFPRLNPKTWLWAKYDLCWQNLTFSIRNSPSYLQRPLLFNRSTSLQPGEFIFTHLDETTNILQQGLHLLPPLIPSSLKSSGRKSSDSGIRGSLINRWQRKAHSTQCSPNSTRQSVILQSIEIMSL